MENALWALVFGVVLESAVIAWGVHRIADRVKQWPRR